MTDIILSGCCGRMGQTIVRLAEEREDLRIVAGVDQQKGSSLPFPVYQSLDNCPYEADVLVDFSHPDALASLLPCALEKNLPAVLCVTGYSREQVETIKEAAAKLPLFFSANMSLGINLLAALAKQAAAVLGEEFDIEIIEKHHNQKLDAPSGTALLLADQINQVFAGEKSYIYDRHSVRRRREKRELGIHSLRGGTITGEHEVVFAGHDEIITLSHSARSREVFATGALNAALFLSRQPAGLYDMGALLKERV